jgi:hypothetical protein
MKKSYFVGVFGSALLLMSANAQTDCAKTSQRVKNAVKADKSAVLEIVSKEVTAGPDCACEIVKAALEAASAEPKAVAAIVEAAINAAPDKINIISKCALAVAPDAAAEIKAVVDKLGQGNQAFNPLDFPGDNKYGKNANKESGTGDAGESGGMFAGEGGSGSEGIGGGEFGGAGGGGIGGGTGGGPITPIIINPPVVTNANP